MTTPEAPAAEKARLTNVIELLKDAEENVEGLEGLRAIEEKRYRPVSMARQNIRHAIAALSNNQSRLEALAKKIEELPRLEGVHYLYVPYVSLQSVLDAIRKEEKAI